MLSDSYADRIGVRLLFVTMCFAAGCATSGGAVRPSPFPGAPTPPSAPPATLPPPAAPAYRPAARGSQALVDAALDLRGIPYRLGGDDPDIGLDCSGLVRYVFGLQAITVPRTVEEQYRIGL